jgi:hypothetical protein
VRVLPAEYKRGRVFAHFFALILLLSLSPALFAFGGAEKAAEIPAQNGEWIFCVTAFDTSALPASRRIIGDTLLNSLFRSLERVEYRIRPSPEYSWYESAAWAQDRSEAGKKLSAKYEERSQLVYQGYPAWRYRRDLQKLDKEIIALEEAYQLVDGRPPPVESAPVFKLQGADTQGLFPAAPAADRELDFCLRQNVDAFLSGSVSEYYGRLYLTVRVYARYSRTWIYEDATIFSPEDLNPAVDEIASRLAAAIQGAPSAAVRIIVEPPSAMITLKGRYAGRSSPAEGEAADDPAQKSAARRGGEAAALETAPGTAEITAYAEFHRPRRLLVDLEGGTLTTITIALTPLGRSLLTVRDTEKDAAKSAVYQGALYLGPAPVTAEFVSGSAGYFRMEGPDGALATTVIPAGMGAGSYGVNLRLQPPLREGRVEKARREFYGAWGRFWFAMPLSVIMNGLAMTMINAYNINSERSEAQYNMAQNWYYVTMASDVLVALFAGESIIRAIRYASVSARGEPVLERDF